MDYKEILRAAASLKEVSLPLSLTMDGREVIGAKVGDEVDGYKLTHLSLVGTASIDGLDRDYWYNPCMAAIKQNLASIGVEYYSAPIVIDRADNKRAVVCFGVDKV